MKWTHIIKNKILASTALLSLCLLVLASNYIDRKHTEDVKFTISTLYEDRLIAEVYILKMTRSLYEIKEALKSDWKGNATTKRIQKQFSIINTTSEAYLETKFTKLEKVKAAELLKLLTTIETSSLENNVHAVEKIDKGLDLLNELSAIQLAESKKIMSYAEKLYLSGKTANEFIVALIIIILIVLQAIVFSSRTIIIKDSTKFPSLN